jgi:mono/diheme cytochrome c family protein
VLLSGLAVPGTLGELRASDGEVFANYCVACHGTDGRARTPQGRKLKARDLRDSRLMDAEIRRVVREGVRTPAGAVRMPAFAEQLSTDEIEAVVRAAKAFRPAGS